jgi:hypothetical protein
VKDGVMFCVVFFVYFMPGKGREIVVILLEFCSKRIDLYSSFIIGRCKVHNEHVMSNLIASSQLLKLLSPYRAVYQNGPVVVFAPDTSSAAGSPESKNQVPSPATPVLKKKKKFPEAGNVTVLLHMRVTSMSAG